MKVVRRRQAVEDIDEHAAFIADRNVRAAYRFLDKVEETFDLLARHPRIGSTRFDGIVPGLRAWPVVSFRLYIILYFVNRNAGQIARIVHGARDLQALFSGPWEKDVGS